jgi:hypothetical protein
MTERRNGKIFDPHDGTVRAALAALILAAVMLELVVHEGRSDLRNKAQ